MDLRGHRVRSHRADGVTTIEIKAGYGLDYDGERKMLQVARDLGAAFRDIGKILFVRPFMDQRIGDKNDPAFVDHSRNANRARGGRGIENMVDQFEHMGRLAGRAGYESITMAMCQHQRAKHMAIPRGKSMNILPVKAFTLKSRI